jgi:hypothetical protein
MTYEEIDKIFTYHAPNDTQRVRYETLRKEARLFAHTINGMCPESREKSLAITKIQEAVMFANAAIAIHE